MPVDHKEHIITSQVLWSAFNSICSGLCAASAGMFGKLSGADFSVWFVFILKFNDKLYNYHGLFGYRNDYNTDILQTLSLHL